MNLATKKWIFMKISSVILVPLMLWFIFNFISIYNQNYLEVLSFFTNSANKFLFSFFIVFAYFYSSLSIILMGGVFAGPIPLVDKICVI